ncbi:hypothetical protein MMPV_005522 [Pyropia vietnamensis]
MESRSLAITHNLDADVDDADSDGDDSSGTGGSPTPSFPAPTTIDDPPSMAGRAHRDPKDHGVFAAVDKSTLATTAAALATAAMDNDEVPVAEEVQAELVRVEAVCALGGRPGGAGDCKDGGGGGGSDADSDVGERGGGGRGAEDKDDGGIEDCHKDGDVDLDGIPPHHEFRFRR